MSENATCVNIIEGKPCGKPSQFWAYFGKQLCHECGTAWANEEDKRQGQSFR